MSRGRPKVLRRGEEFFLVGDFDDPKGEIGPLPLAELDALREDLETAVLRYGSGRREGEE